MGPAARLAVCVWLMRAVAVQELVIDRVAHEVVSIPESAKRPTEVYSRPTKADAFTQVCCPLPGLPWCVCG